MKVVKSFSLGSFTDPGRRIIRGRLMWTGRRVGSYHLQHGCYGNNHRTQSHTYADGPHTYTVTVKVTDKNGAFDSKAFQVTVANVAPVVDAGACASINEGGTFTGSGSFADPGTDTWTATVDYGDGTGVQSLTITQARTSTSAMSMLMMACTLLQLLLVMTMVEWALTLQW